MKKRWNIRLDLCVQVSIICMVELVLVALLASLAGQYLSQVVQMTIVSEMPLFVWVILFSVVIGGAVTTYVVRTFIVPITELGHAMNEVARGNFQISLTTKSRLRDIRDIYSNFNLMVRELNATETLQTDFISNISHEFKTPISAIEGYVSLLQDARQSPQEQEAYAEKILLSARRLSTLTGNILLLSKLDNQSIRPALTNFRLDEQIRQAFVSLESRWTEKNIDFDIDLNEIWYNGYEGLTIHIWTNLIDNAIKFDPQDGLIRMRLFERAARVYFVIEDNGPGIREADQKRIFNKFYQGDTSRRMEGNGLGLSLVKQIVEMSGGEIAVENLPQGGCRFTVSLPREVQS